MTDKQKSLLLAEFKIDLKYFIKLYDVDVRGMFKNKT